MTSPTVEGRPADWAARAGAFGIDVLCGLAALTCLLLVGWSAPRGGWVWWLCMVAAAALLVVMVANRLVLPAATGWSLGRSVFGIRVVGRDGAAVGPWRLLARDTGHLLDTVPLLLGWLWPLIDRRGRTFADVLARTEVRPIGGAPDRRRTARRAVAGLTALAVAASLLGYLGVFRPQRAADAARAQIAEQGPKIVADMLSYKAASAQQDFEHDQTLVTDAYRPELTRQQDSVRKTPVDNDYWSTNSAVLSASADRATMLVLLQGQRGVAPKQRFITASLRVDFEKTAGDWLVAGLTVLTPPKPAEPAPAPPPAPPAAKPGGGR